MPTRRDSQGAVSLLETTGSTAKSPGKNLAKPPGKPNIDGMPCWCCKNTLALRWVRAFDEKGVRQWLCGRGQFAEQGDGGALGNKYNHYTLYVMKDGVRPPMTLGFATRWEGLNKRTEATEPSYKSEYDKDFWLENTTQRKPSSARYSSRKRGRPARKPPSPPGQATTQATVLYNAAPKAASKATARGASRTPVPKRRP